MAVAKFQSESVRNGDEDGFLKLLFRQDDLKLIGVHIMGDLGTEVVHIGLVAIMGNASANLFVDACLNSPTLGMLYKTATLNALQNAPPFRKACLIERRSVKTSTSGAPVMASDSAPETNLKWNNGQS